MKKELINKYKSYIADAESKMSSEKDHEKMSVLATCIYCYKEILRDLKQPNPISDKELRKQLEETWESNMIYFDIDKIMKIAKQFANT